MAVLVEAISVIVKRERIGKVFPGGWDGFVRSCPNATLCADGHIARVGFMSPDDVRAFVERLEALGFRFREGTDVDDVVVVDQLTGPTAECSWAETGTVTSNGHRVTACRLRGDSDSALVTPDGWNYEGSLSDQPGFVSKDEFQERMSFVRVENGLEVWLDKKTGGEEFLGRTRTAAFPVQGRSDEEEAD